MSTQPNAFDPSTWGDAGSDEGSAAGVGIGALDARLVIDAPPAVSRADLEAELADLRELRRSNARKIEKLQGFIDAGEAELRRINLRLDELDMLIDQSYADEDEG